MAVCPRSMNALSTPKMVLPWFGFPDSRNCSSSCTLGACLTWAAGEGSSKCGEILSLSTWGRAGDKKRWSFLRPGSNIRNDEVASEGWKSGDTCLVVVIGTDSQSGHQNRRGGSGRQWKAVGGGGIQLKGPFRSTSLVLITRSKVGYGGSSTVDRTGRQGQGYTSRSGQLTLTAVHITQYSRR